MASISISIVAGILLFGMVCSYRRGFVFGLFVGLALGATGGAQRAYSFFANPGSCDVDGAPSVILIQDPVADATMHDDAPFGNFPLARGSRQIDKTDAKGAYTFLNIRTFSSTKSMQYKAKYPFVAQVEQGERIRPKQPFATGAASSLTVTSPNGRALAIVVLHLKADYGALGPITHKTRVQVVQQPGAGSTHFEQDALEPDPSNAKTGEGTLSVAGEFLVDGFNITTATRPGPPTNPGDPTQPNADMGIIVEQIGCAVF